MILSTCNRVELVAAYELALPDIEAWFTQYFPEAADELRPHLYQYRDADAVRHLFRVAASLDSMVVGEPQILGQVKESYTVVCSNLHSLLPRRCGRKPRSDPPLFRLLRLLSILPARSSARSKVSRCCWSARAR